MPVFNKYHYEPLIAEDAVRLVVLDPARVEEAPLSCSIIQKLRSIQPADYSAVSYAWGAPEFSRNLEVRCDSDTSYLRITPNVDALLRHFRTHSQPQYLWIDSLCLNQDDEIEKAQQILAMGQIYTQAKQVFIWLGRGDHMTPKLFAFFRKASRLPDMEQLKMAKRIAFFMRKFGHNDFYTLFEALVAFFDRPWFSRRWVIQEACLAREATVFCGSCTISLPLLASAATRFQSLDMSSYPVKMATIMGKVTTKRSMLELLWNFHEAGCLEPKDRIVAFLGLVPDEDRFRLDYTVHWTELYKQVASSVLGVGNNNTRLLLLAQLFEFGPVSPPQDPTYPSWVPDWSNVRLRKLPYYSDFRNVDTHEQCPNFSGISERATLTFQENSLQIHWKASNWRLRGRRVIYTRKFDSPPQSE